MILFGETLPIAIITCPDGTIALVNRVTLVFALSTFVCPTVVSTADLGSCG